MLTLPKNSVSNLAVSQLLDSPSNTCVTYVRAVGKTERATSSQGPAGRGRRAGAMLAGRGAVHTPAGQAGIWRTDAEQTAAWRQGKPAYWPFARRRRPRGIPRDPPEAQRGLFPGSAGATLARLASAHGVTAACPPITGRSTCSLTSHRNQNKPRTKGSNAKNKMKTWK